ncbi:MAG: hypothetical protein OXG44_15870 [Gammaproteobacteria bacterium]|nr:hypothetical protein [Gammaproteobacteria bacterium]
MRELKSDEFGVGWLTVKGDGPSPARWGMDGDEELVSDIDGRVEEVIDTHWCRDPYPRTLEIFGFVPMKADIDMDRILDNMFEDLEEDYGYEDMNAGWKPTEKILDAAEKLRRAFLEDYPVNLYQPCGVFVEIDVRAWMSGCMRLDPETKEKRLSKPGDFREGAETWAELFERGASDE